MAKGSREKSDEVVSGRTKAAIIQQAKDYGAIIGGWVGTLWVLQLLNVLTGYALTKFGALIPVRFAGGGVLQGLKGLLLSPFLHGSWSHLISNTMPLAVLSFIVMLRRKRDLLY